MGIDAQMFVKLYTNEINYDQLKNWSYIFGSAFHDSLSLGHNEEIYSHPLEIISKYIQDGPTIYPQKNEVFLNIPIQGRYYGPGYERGPLMTYIIMAEFLEKLIPNCEIWYGGDSSGVLAEKFDSKKREEFLNYFIANKGRDNYNRFFDKENDGPNCPLCNIKMIRCGWGPNYKHFNCNGCGWSYIEKDNIIKKGFLK